MTFRNHSRLVAAVLVAGFALLTAAVAHAANGITVVSPKAGVEGQDRLAPDVQGQGRRRRHRLRPRLQVQEEGRRRRDLQQGARSARPRSKGGTASLKPPIYNYPAFWLNSPGTYYWQAYRINCEGDDLDDCQQEGPIVKFKVG